MVLADTSIWITHFREGDHHFETLLKNNEVMVHPYVIGELACGNLVNRQKILEYLTWLPLLDKVKDEEVLYFIERHRLMGKGIGYIAAALLAAAALARVRIWTRDSRLMQAAGRVGLDYEMRT